MQHRTEETFDILKQLIDDNISNAKKKELLKRFLELTSETTSIQQATKERHDEEERELNNLSGG